MTAFVCEAESAALVLDGAVLLRETSLRAGSGECVAVLGPNGAGKTTLLRLLAGSVRPSSGSVRVRGEPADERRERQRATTAALIEPPALYPDLTIADHLELIATLWEGVSPDVVPGLGRAALEAFGLAPLRGRFPDELSSGQRQLLSLAATFARPADLVLLDEPEQRLDPGRRELLSFAMRAACDRGAAVVFASHDAQLVARVADRSVQVGR